MTILGNGNVGIGTASPSDLLELGVNKNISIYGFSTLGSTFSQAGTVLGYNAKADTVNNVADQVVVSKTNAAIGYQYIKMSDNGGMQFHVLGGSVTAGAVASAEHMRITNAGNVGIGTTTPGALLHVSSSGSTASYIDSTVAATYPHLLIRNTNTGEQFKAQSLGGYVVSGSANNIPYALITNNTERMRVSATGDVGIGTTVPASILHVRGTSPYVTLDTAAATQDAWYMIYENGVTKGAMKWNNSSSASAVELVNYTAGPLNFYTQSTNRMTVSAAGNVGIGTISPTHSLEVSGNTDFALPSAVLANAMGTIDAQESRRVNLNFDNITSQNISNIAVTSGSNWKIVFKGIWTNNFEGGGLVQPASYIEVTSASASLPVGAIILNITRHAGTGKLQGLTTSPNASKAIGFSGVIDVYSNNINVIGTNSMALAGNLGLGTSNPSSLLHVSGGAAKIQINSPNPYNTMQTPLSLVNGAGNQGAGAQIDFQVGIAIPYINAIVDGPNSISGAALTFGTPATGTNGTERMRISSTGSVGIGTTNPSSQLTVYSSSAAVNHTISGNDPYIPSGLIFEDNGQTTSGKVKKWAIWQGRDGGTWQSGLGFMRYDAVNPCAGGICDMPFFLHDNGNVGIGTGNPSAKLSVDTSFSLGISGSWGEHLKITEGSSPIAARMDFAGDGSGWRFDIGRIGVGSPYMSVTDTGGIGIGTTAPDAMLSVNGTASKVGGGSWATFSDLRLKDVIGEFNYGLDDVLKIRPIFYHYKENNVRNLPSRDEHVGIVAQELQAIIPEAISITKDGYLMVNNDPVIWAMVNAFKDVDKRFVENIMKFETMKNGIEELRQDMREAKRAIASLQEKVEQLDQQNKKISNENSQMKAALCSINKTFKFCRQ
jgi:hypothetical protein